MKRGALYMEKDKATMRDIAQACGISVATVSYVLNHSEKEKISHETRLKVLETATRLHYEPHSVRTLGQTKSGTDRRDRHAEGNQHGREKDDVL
jgi:hypothetical protein